MTNIWNWLTSIQIKHKRNIMNDTDTEIVKDLTEKKTRKPKEVTTETTDTQDIALPAPKRKRDIAKIPPKKPLFT